MKLMESMELVVSIQNRESLATALDKGVGGVAAHLPRNPDSQVFSELADWRDAARQQKVKFYLTWDWLVRERELAGVPDMLAAVARLDPDGLQLRDLGLVREARRRYPDLPLQAAGNFGIHNSPGVRLAATLGFSRVVVAGPISLKDLALMRRQTAMPLAVTLATFCPGYAGLCLMEEYLGVSCEACCLARPENAGTLMATLETLSGLCQLGIEAVQLQGELFAPASLARVIGLCQAVATAAPMERPRVLAAAREVVEAFGETLRMSPPAPGTPPGPPVYPLPPAQRVAQSSSRPGLLGRGRVWLEVRDYAEAAALAREWREPLVLGLTSDTYAAFLQEHRQWDPRRLIWRLPPAIPESALGFYQKALETLRQGGYQSLCGRGLGRGGPGGGGRGPDLRRSNPRGAQLLVRGRRPGVQSDPGLPAPGTSVRSLAGDPGGDPVRQFLELPLPLRRPGRLPRRSRGPDPAGEPALDGGRRQGPPVPQSSPESPRSGPLVQTAVHPAPGGGPAPQPPAPGPTPPLAGPPPFGPPPPVNKLQAQGLFDIFMTKIRDISSKQGVW